MDCAEFSQMAMSMLDVGEDFVMPEPAVWGKTRMGRMRYWTESMLFASW